jgi:GTPase
MGVLVGGKTDDGSGLVRCNVAKHRHEKFSGTTSSINQQIIGFDAKGNITNKSLFGLLDWPEILELSSKVIRFVDVSGQEKYSKSMVVL